MKQLFKSLTVIGAIFVLSSFSDTNNALFIGTYGVSENDPSQIQLTIHSDHSFYYQDFSVSNAKLVVSGKWTFNGKKLRLQSNDAKTKFHKVWTFSEQGQVAKSRKGLCFYRLCKIEGK